MMAVQYDRYGGVDVLEVREVPTPTPAPGEVLVEVRAAGINPGEGALRSGVFAEAYPSTFPSGQGSDLAGVITVLGEGITGWIIGDEIVGWVNTRASHADYVTVPADQLIAKPPSVDWAVGGALYVAGATAWAAVRAVDPQPGEIVVVSGAAGGVGGLVAQLAVERGATVLGLASETNHVWLEEHGTVPISYADGPDATADRIRANAPNGVAAFIDTFGQGYVELALSLSVPVDRINTIIDFTAVAKHGVQSAGNTGGANLADMTELVTRLGDGRLELPVATRYPLTDVRAAFRELERRHTRGKIVLVP